MSSWAQKFDWKRGKVKRAKGGPKFDLSRRIMKLDGHGTALRWRDILESVLVVGGPGSGKSSTAMKQLGLSALRNGAGMVFTCTKATDARDYRELCRTAGREADIIEVKPKGRWRNNVIETAFSQVKGAGGTENVVKLLAVAGDALEDNGDRAVSSDPIWPQARDQFIRNLVDLLKCAGEEISMWKIADLVASAPQTPKQARELEHLGRWLRSGKGSWEALSFFQQCWVNAQANQRDGRHEIDSNTVEATVLYWRHEFVELPEKTRQSVVFTLRAATGALLRGDIADLCTTKSTFSFSALRRGKILLLNLPTRTYGDSGRVVQKMMLQLAQAELEKDSVDPESNVRPVVFFMDEVHTLATRSDVNFLSLSRGSRACALMATQSVSGLRQRLGSDGVEALLANVQTKFLFACDGETARWASELIEQDYAWQATLSADGGISATKAKKNLVEPVEFMRLRRGGAESGYQVDCFITKPGAEFGAEKRHFMRMRFSQRRRPRNAR